MWPLLTGTLWPGLFGGEAAEVGDLKNKSQKHKYW